MHHVDMRHTLEQFSGDVRHGSSSGRCHAELARICLCIGDEFGECLRRKSGIDAQDNRLLEKIATGALSWMKFRSELMILAEEIAKKSV